MAATCNAVQPASVACARGAGRVGPASNFAEERDRPLYGTHKAGASLEGDATPRGTMLMHDACGFFFSLFRSNSSSCAWAALIASSAAHLSASHASPPYLRTRLSAARAPFLLV